MLISALWIGNWPYPPHILVTAVEFRPDIPFKVLDPACSTGLPPTPYPVGFFLPQPSPAVANCPFWCILKGAVPFFRVTFFPHLHHHPVWLRLCGFLVLLTAHSFGPTSPPPPGAFSDLAFFFFTNLRWFAFWHFF